MPCSGFRLQTMEWKSTRLFFFSFFFKSFCFSLFFCFIYGIDNGDAQVPAESCVKAAIHQSWRFWSFHVREKNKTATKRVGIFFQYLPASYLLLLCFLFPLLFSYETNFVDSIRRIKLIPSYSFPIKKNLYPHRLTNKKNDNTSLKHRQYLFPASSVGIF